jgi:hypothetical protein
MRELEEKAFAAMVSILLQWLVSSYQCESFEAGRGLKKRKIEAA